MVCNIIFAKKKIFYKDKTENRVSSENRPTTMQLKSSYQIYTVTTNLRERRAHFSGPVR